MSYPSVRSGDRTSAHKGRAWSWSVAGVAEAVVLIWVVAVCGYYYWSMGYLRLAAQILGFPT